MPFPLLAAIPAAFQIGTGIAQLFGGKKQLDGLQRPQYEIPKEVDQALNLAAVQYQDTYTAAQTNAMRNIGATGANAVTSGRDSGNLAAVLPSIVAQQSQGFNNLAAQMDDQKAQQRSALTNMLDLKAKYQDQKWQMNEFAPYQQKYNEGRERIGAGQQNIFGGLNSLGSIGVMASSLNRATPPPSQMAPIVSDATSAAGGVQGAIDAFTAMTNAGKQAGAGIYDYMMGQRLARNYPY